ncbi:MAG: spermine synthase [Candidatus Omnitrophota bacterium]
MKGQVVGAKFLARLDFGLTEIEALRCIDSIELGEHLSLSLDEKIKDKFCYVLDSQGVREIAFFAQDTNRFYKLIPTFDWPSFAIGSVPMHKISSPKADTERKIAVLEPYGRVLDTCMGLGYTAIMAAQKAKEVITFEKDNNVEILAQANPVSQPLFSGKNIKNIEVRREDVSCAISSFKEGYFDCIIHDPPTFKLAPPLYTVSFYKELLTVLKRGGKMFHYTPLYKVKKGFDFPSRIKKRLQEAGFRNPKFSSGAGGILCWK